LAVIPYEPKSREAEGKLARALLRLHGYTQASAAIYWCDAAIKDVNV
jgi:hypothetical protein